MQIYTYKLGPFLDLIVVISIIIRIQKHKQLVLQVNDEHKPMLQYNNWKTKLTTKKLIIEPNFKAIVSAKMASKERKDRACKQNCKQD